MEKTGDTSSITLTPDHYGDQNRPKATTLLSMPDNMTMSKENVIQNIDPAIHPQEEIHEYLTGLKLFVVMLCITLASFLLLLDSSVVSTVSLRIP